MRVLGSGLLPTDADRDAAHIALATVHEMKPEVGTRWRRILVNKTVGWIGGGIVDKTVAAIAAPLVLNPIQTTTSAPPSGNFVGSSGGGFSLPKTGGQTTTPFPAAAPNSSLWGKIKSFFDW